MDLVLAMDLRSGMVVHGMRGMRSTYRPLTWGLSPSADPREYLLCLSPRFLYIADLDRISGRGSHEREIRICSSLVERCYVDRGCRTPEDYLDGAGITNIAATETSQAPLSQYHGGFLSIDVKDGVVIPSGEDPGLVMKEACSWDFEGCILLNIGAVGTGEGIREENLSALRETYDRTLFYGGGVGSTTDLDRLSNLGFDGAIVATGVHRGRIPLDALRRGVWC
ncbi:MAG: nickel transporter [Methanolinea sp.]|nr:nickel transporter [Methanolinea sp.]